MQDINQFRQDPKSYHEDAASCDAEAFCTVVESRRSIRRFTPEEIPEKITQACLDLALQAPNSSNLQAWEFHWVRTPALKQKLVEGCLSQSAAATAAELIVCVARTSTWRRNTKLVAEQMVKEGLPTKTTLAYYQKLVYLVYPTGPLSLLAPFKFLLFTAIGLFRPILRGPLTRNDRAIWAIKTTALACENLMLAYRAYGFDSCPMEGFDEWRVRRLLKLPGDAEVVMVIGAGRRAHGGVYGPKLRLPRALFVFQH